MHTISWLASKDLVGCFLKLWGLKSLPDYVFLGHFAYIFWIEMKDHGVAETSTWETKHHTWRVGELRFITRDRPRGVNTPSSEPQTKGYRVFIHGQAWLSGFAGAGQLQRAGKGEWDKLQFLALWVPTFWDYMTYVIQTLQGTSWVTEAEGAGGYVKL